jgi:hypothetical protein
MAFKDPEKQRSYQREWVAKRRAEWFSDKSCIDCGTTEGLELDHVDPTKKVSHAIWSWSTTRRDEEIAKCVARCKFCHLAKTRANGEHINHPVILTDDQIREIRRLHDIGVSYNALIKLFPRSRSTIRRICARQDYKHVEDNVPVVQPG